MIELQIYLDAFAFLIRNTDVLIRFGWTVAIGILIGALFLDRFKIWRWAVILLTFLALTQWQVQEVMEVMGFSRLEILQPHIITIIAGICFAFGAWGGYWLRFKCTLAYTKQNPHDVAHTIIEEVNGNVTETSNANSVIIEQIGGGGND